MSAKIGLLIVKKRNDEQIQKGDHISFGFFDIHFLSCRIFYVLPTFINSFRLDGGGDSSFESSADDADADEDQQNNENLQVKESSSENDTEDEIKKLLFFFVLLFSVLFWVGGGGVSKFLIVQQRCVFIYFYENTSFHFLVTIT